MLQATTSQMIKILPESCKWFLKNQCVMSVQSIEVCFCDFPHTMLQTEWFFFF